MSSNTPRSGSSGRRLLVTLVTATGVLLLTQSVAFAEPMPVTAPVIPGTPALPGAVVDPGRPAEPMKTLTTKPDVAPAGAALTVSGTGLPPSKAVTLVWMTANIRYVLDPKPDSVDYIGRKVDKIAVALAKTTTNAAGGFSVGVKAPVDFGGLHDLYAVVDGLQVAKGGFLLERKVTISPKRGPVGTPITVKVVGMGSPTYGDCRRRPLRQPLHRRRLQRTRPAASPSSPCAQPARPARTGSSTPAPAIRGRI